MAIEFRAEDHSYTSTDQDKIDWISVTSFVALFKTPFDQQGVAEKCSKNSNSKWYGLTPEEVIEYWNKEADRANTLGSWYHDQRERELLMCETIQRDGIDVPIIQPIEQNGLKYAPDQSLTSGIYPEHLAYLKSAKICGQADRVEVVGRFLDIFDYKTNKKIETEAYVNWEGVEKKMLRPLAHIPDCNFYHYALQLSIYMYIINKHNRQLKPRKMEIHHVSFEVEDEDEFGFPIMARNENGDPIIKELTPYELPYLKTEVRSMIKYVKQHPEVIKKGHV